MGCDLPCLRHDAGRPAGVAGGICWETDWGMGMPKMHHQLVRQTVPPAREIQGARGIRLLDVPPELRHGRATHLEEDALVMKFFVRPPDRLVHVHDRPPHVGTQIELQLTGELREEDGRRVAGLVRPVRRPPYRRRATSHPVHRSNHQNEYWRKAWRAAAKENNPATPRCASSGGRGAGAGGAGFTGAAETSTPRFGLHGYRLTIFLGLGILAFSQSSASSRSAPTVSASSPATISFTRAMAVFLKVGSNGV